MRKRRPAKLYVKDEKAKAARLRRAKKLRALRDKWKRTPVRIRRFQELPALVGRTGVIISTLKFLKDGTVKKQGYVTVLIRSRTFIANLNLPWSDIEVLKPGSRKTRNVAARSILFRGMLVH